MYLRICVDLCKYVYAFEIYIICFSRIISARALFIWNEHKYKLILSLRGNIFWKCKSYSLLKGIFIRILLNDQHLDEGKIFLLPFWNKSLIK